jgi:hypothetical protein
MKHERTEIRKYRHCGVQKFDCSVNRQRVRGLIASTAWVNVGSLYKLRQKGSIHVMRSGNAERADNRNGSCIAMLP